MGRGRKAIARGNSEIVDVQRSMECRL